MRLAELMMDTAVSTALKGKTMDQADMVKDRTRHIRGQGRVRIGLWVERVWVEAAL